jgi:dihydrolipoamide dehydrogenase
MESLPESVAVIGQGVIGLEIGQSMHRLGVKVTGIDQQTIISGIQDKDINQVAIEIIGKEFPLWLGQAAEIKPLDNGKLQVSAGDNSVEVDKIFASIGRRPNTDKLQLQNTSSKLSDNGVPEYDPQTMQLGNSSIYIAGDCTADSPILHEAGFEGRVAGYNTMQPSPTRFRKKTALVITFCDPNIVAVGQQLSELNPDEIVIGEIRMSPVGRALIMGKNKGLIHIYAEKKTGKLLGASMICTKGENLGHLLCWSIEMGLTVQQMLALPFYHPVIEEALQAALYNALGQLEIDTPEWPIELQPLSS